MSAQRGLPSEAVDAMFAAPVDYRATRRASRAVYDDILAEPRAPRPAMRAIAAPVTFSVVRTRYTSPTDKQRQRRRLTKIVAPLAIAALFATAGLSGSGFSFAADSPAAVSTSLEPLTTDLSQVPQTATDPFALPLALGIADASTVVPAGAAAADALDTDAAVKQAAADKAAADEEAAKAAAEEAAKIAAAQAAAEQAAAAQKAAAAQAAAAQAAADKAKTSSSAKTKTNVPKSSSSSSSSSGQGYSNGTSATQSYDPGVAKGQFIWPVSGAKVTSPFGYRNHPIGGYYELHDGIDLAIKCGTPIHASGDGVVTRAGWNGALGNYTQISHGNGLATGYGHQSRIAVSVGQTVKKGDVIGYVGSSGNSTGCHVHFQALHNGDVFKPSNLVK